MTNDPFPFFPLIVLQFYSSFSHQFSQLNGLATFAIFPPLSKITFEIVLFPLFHQLVQSSSKKEQLNLSAP